MRTLALELRAATGCGPISWILLLATATAAILLALHGWREAVTGSEDGDLVRAVNALVMFAGSTASMLVAILVLAFNLTRETP